MTKDDFWAVIFIGYWVVLACLALLDRSPIVYLLVMAWAIYNTVDYFSQS